VDKGKKQESYRALAQPAREAISEWRWKQRFFIAQHNFGVFSGRTLACARFTARSPTGRTGE
jgi:hypothetical protein